MSLDTNATGPIVTVLAISVIKVWNCVARTTVTGSLLRSSTSSQAYFTR